MTIRHLKIFLAVVDYNGMSAAAKALYVSQPTVSQAIAELENHYNVRLFERLSQKLYITEEGRRLLPFARHIVDSFEKMELEMQAGNKEFLRIGCSVSVGTCMINNILDRAEACMPELNIQVVVDNTSAIEEKVLKNEVDLGIVEGVVKSPEIDSYAFCDDELVVVCATSYHLTDRKNLQIDDLSGERLISRESGSIERNQLELLFENHGVHFDRCFTCTNTEAIKNAVLRGRGIAVLSRRMVENECRRGDMICLELPGVPVRRTIHLVKHRNKFVSEGMKLIMSMEIGSPISGEKLSG